MKGPFFTGHSSVDLGDMQQYKNIINDPKTELDAIYELEDMVQNSLRYTKEQKAAFLKLIQKEKFKVQILYDDPKLQRMAEADPEGFDRWLDYMISKDPSAGGFATGGRVGLHEGGMLGSMGVEDGSYQAAEQAQNPYQAQIDPHVQTANQHRQYFTQRVNERNNDLISRLSPFQVAQQGNQLSNLPGSQEVSNLELGRAINQNHNQLLQAISGQKGGQGVSAFGQVGGQQASNVLSSINMQQLGGQLGIGGLFGMRS